MRFEATWRSYSTRYCGGLIGLGIMFAWMLFYPIALGKGFMFIEAFKDLFLRDKKKQDYFWDYVFITNSSVTFALTNSLSF